MKKWFDVAVMVAILAVIAVLTSASTRGLALPAAGVPPERVSAARAFPAGPALDSEESYIDASSLGTPVLQGGSAMDDERSVPRTPAPNPAVVPSEQSFPGVSARSYLVIDAMSGKKLLQYHAQDRRQIASLTKIMTALIVFERGKLDDTVTVPETIAALDYSNTLMGLTPGEQISVRDLLYGMMLPSGNDASIALATHSAGSEDIFVREMNRRAVQLGLRNTRFVNSHGLDGRTGNQYSTAEDLATLTLYAMQNPDFRAMVAMPWYVAQTGSFGKYLLRNSNALVYSYAGAHGVKIGYTRRAGQTMVGSAYRDGRWLIAVILGSTQRGVDAQLLLDKGFELAQQQG